MVFLILAQDRFCPANHDLKLTRRPVRTRMPGGVAGTQSMMTAPYAVSVSCYFGTCTIFMADEIRAATSVMLLGTMRVVVASAATLE